MIMSNKKNHKKINCKQKNYISFKKINIFLQEIHHKINIIHKIAHKIVIINKVLY